MTDGRDVKLALQTKMYKLTEEKHV